MYALLAIVAQRYVILLEVFMVNNFFGWHRSFLRNYNAKYMASGSGTPLIHAIVAVAALGYALEIPHLRRTYFN
jgi:hypothetical protein